MTSEKSLWTYLCKGLRGQWHPQRHEDRCATGVPDVSYGLNSINGWIELKCLPQLPRAKFFIGLTKEQAAWLIQRGRHGGHCFIFLQIGREYLLFSWHAALYLTEYHDRWNTLESHACARWHGKVDFVKLKTILGG